MINTHDVAIVGLGAHGAALAHELARRGVSVIGLDAYTPPHEHGSTTGRTRITREAYYEAALYVPLVQRATELWRELEELTGTVLLRPTGALMAGPEGGELVRGALISAQVHDIPHEQLDAFDMRRRFPALDPPVDAVGIYEPNAGILMVDACMRTLLDQAAAYGAELRTGVRVTAWSATDDGVVLSTTDGDVRAARAVFAAGAWLNPLLWSEATESPIELALGIERQIAHWFAPAPGVTGLHASVFPITMLERTDGRMLYTVPDIGHGVKAAFHHDGLAVTADTVDRTIGTAEEERVRSALEEWLPGAAQRVLDSGVCLYTNTPDRNFVVDAHPSHANVLMVSACSGHGFKFATALAEVVSDIVLEGGSAFDISRFRAERVLAL